MVTQTSFTLRPRGRGFHLVTDEVLAHLPALPDAWADGEVNGLKAEGNFTIDMEWKNKKVTKLKITSGSGGKCTVYNPGMKLNVITDSKGIALKIEKQGESMVSIDTKKGMTYCFDL